MLGSPSAARHDPTKFYSAAIDFENYATLRGDVNNSCTVDLANGTAFIRYLRTQTSSWAGCSLIYSARPANSCLELYWKGSRARNRSLNLPKDEPRFLS